MILKRLEKGMVISTFAVLRSLIKKFQWVHISLGLIGNTSFFIGSIFFLPHYEAHKKIGVWLFIVGAFGMLLGSIGQAIVKYEEVQEQTKKMEGQ